MNEAPSPATVAPFELVGRFGGFVFTEAGKRRMLLRVEGQADDCLLKVPRTLRRRIVGKFRPEEPIRVAIVEERDLLTGVFKRIVSQVLPLTAASSAAPLPPPAAAVAVNASPIRVCGKKNCWRNGGRELWESLGREIAARGAAGRIELRVVGCLDRCKRAPNVDCGGREYSRCSPGEAGAIIDRAMEGATPTRRG